MNLWDASDIGYSAKMSADPDRVFRRMFQRRILECLNLQAIVPHFFKAGLVTASEVEYLLNDLYTPTERILKLTSILPPKGPQSVGQFLECLRQEKDHEGHVCLLDEMEQYLQKTSTHSSQSCEESLKFSGLGESTLAIYIVV